MACGQADGGRSGPEVPDRSVVDPRLGRWRAPPWQHTRSRRCRDGSDTKSSPITRRNLPTPQPPEAGSPHVADSRTTGSGAPRLRKTEPGTASRHTYNKKVITLRAWRHGHRSRPRTRPTSRTAQTHRRSATTNLRFGQQPVAVDQPVRNGRALELRAPCKSQVLSPGFYSKCEIPDARNHKPSASHIHHEESGDDYLLVTLATQGRTCLREQVSTIA